MSHNHNHHPIVIFNKYPISYKKIEHHFTHAHGHGGQNVNKVATKVQLKLKTKDAHLPEDLQEKLENEFPNGHLETEAQDTRHQHKNLEIALHRLKQKIEQALA